MTILNTPKLTLYDGDYIIVIPRNYAYALSTYYCEIYNSSFSNETVRTSYALKEIDNISKLLYL